MSGLDWTEELKKRTGIDFLTTRPMEIEKKSFEIIKGELGDEFVSSYPVEALPVKRRQENLGSRCTVLSEMRM